MVDDASGEAAFARGPRWPGLALSARSNADRAVAPCELPAIRSGLCKDFGPALTDLVFSGGIDVENGSTDFDSGGDQSMVERSLPGLACKVEVGRVHDAHSPC